jgi:hypothetical protein
VELHDDRVIVAADEHLHVERRPLIDLRLLYLPADTWK